MSNTNQFMNVLICLSMFVAPAARAAENGQEQVQEQVIQPDIDRREIEIPRIDTENFEIDAFFGVLSVEDFGAHAVYGVRADYHITEDFFLEGAVGFSSVSDGSFRDFGLTIFPQQNESLFYYNLSVGYNIFPGEIFFRRDVVFSSALYLIAGAGNTNFADEDFFTINAGFGLRVLPRDFISLRLEARDYLWSSDLLGESEVTNNLELTMSAGIYF